MSGVQLAQGLLGYSERGIEYVRDIRNMIQYNNLEFYDAEFRKKWEAIGTPVVGGTPQQFADLIRRDSARLGQVAKAAGAKSSRAIGAANEDEAMALCHDVVTAAGDLFEE